MIVGSSSWEQYTILEDDGEDYDAYREAKSPQSSKDIVVDLNGHYFVPQWTDLNYDESSKTLDCDSSDDDEDAFLANRNASNRIGAFPGMEQCNITFEPPSLEGEHHYINTVNDVRAEFLIPKQFVRVSDSNTVFPAGVHSETDEETSSSSGSSTAEDSVGIRDSRAELQDERRRSIRFMDEIEGQQLTTIHFVPWTEHDDANWIPRPVRCRIEL